METEICKCLDAYLTGEMQSEEQSAFESHLAICSICQERKGHSMAIDQLLHEQHAGVVMRPEFQEQVLASLVGATKSELQTVELNMRHRADRAVAINTILPWSIGTAFVVAVILWFALFVPKRSVDDTLRMPDSNAGDLARAPFDPIPSTPAIEGQPVAAVAAPGYLCARIESEETDIEFYIVRPVFHKN